MPDPVKNAEIEDVLSSIRRLVADDAPAPIEPPAPPKAEGADRLVLTPALRIQPQETKAAEAPAPEPAPVDDWEEVTLEDRIAELEAAVASSDDEYEPDGSEVEPAETTMDLSAFEDDAFELSPEHAVHPAEEAAPAPEIDVAPEVQDAVQEAPDAPAEENAADPSQDNVFEDDLSEVFDEEMLRDLVSEFVRKELQGELGERITRNVRKLVRREINRALAARDFE